MPGRCQARAQCPFQHQQTRPACISALMRSRGRIVHQRETWLTTGNCLPTALRTGKFFAAVPEGGFRPGSSPTQQTLAYLHVQQRGPGHLDAAAMILGRQFQLVRTQHQRADRRIDLDFAPPRLVQFRHVRSPCVAIGAFMHRGRFSGNAPRPVPSGADAPRRPPRRADADRRSASRSPPAGTRTPCGRRPACCRVPRQRA